MIGDGLCLVYSILPVWLGCLPLLSFRLVVCFKLFVFQYCYIDMNLQMYIVILIGVIVLTILLRGVLRFFFSKESSRKCGSCSSCEFNPLNDKHTI